MTNNDKLEKLQGYVDTLRAQGRIRTQNDMAELIGVNRSVLSSAMNGNPRYLTDSLLKRIRPFVEHDESKNVVKTVEVPAEKLMEMLDRITIENANLSALSRSQQDTIAFLTGAHEKKEATASPFILRR